MRLLALRSTGIQAGVAHFAVTIQTDDGAYYTVHTDGQHLDDPALFAEHAAARTRRPCTSEYLGDAGGWQQHLGELLARTATLDPPRSNMSPAPSWPSSTSSARRADLLGASHLGQVTLSAEHALRSQPQPEPVQMAETFFERVRRQEAEATRRRRQGLARFLKLTPLGRDVLAATDDLR